MNITCYGDSLTAGVPGASFLDELQARLPEHKFTNCGKGGDTVISLCRRIERCQLQSPADIAVLWVGVNDVLGTLSVGHSLLKRIMRQPCAKDQVEFGAVYRRTLDTLCRRATHVLAISPLLVGEDLTNRWNRELRGLCEIIASASSSFDAVQYVDLHTDLADRLPADGASRYLPRRVAAIARDSIVLRTAGQANRASSRRGLRLTLDGVHLNSAGATGVAAALSRVIQDLCHPAILSDGQESLPHGKAD